ncbi:YnbE family lipoprotein [Photobacterium piscicola]|uniref:YnbE family lipoprotein n=1 Tax=Photobacterium piscicola TaxID=1378299 RepID=A0ABU6LGN4_9GAMM|nr:YnbE family lipoprotein [Photobacterium piscicola]MEC6881976.1 YnbE family lipoprotein [Photobacterium piscicola]MEC6898510.1 YnbE family lipoprotein [Photobacterium piscicola]
MNYFQATLHQPNLHYVFAIIIVLLLVGCTPTIQVAASDKPIEVNLNVKIEHEIKIKVDREIEQLFDNKAVF